MINPGPGFLQALWPIWTSRAEEPMATVRAAHRASHVAPRASTISGLFAQVLIVEFFRRQVAVPVEHAGDRQCPLAFVEKVEDDERMDGVRADAFVNCGADAAGTGKHCEQLDGFLEMRGKPLVAARMPLRVPRGDIDEVRFGVAAQANVEALRGQRCFFSTAAALRPRSAMSRRTAEVSGWVRPASTFATAAPTASRK